MVIYATIEDTQALNSSTDSSNYKSLEDSLRSLQQSVLKQMIAAQGLHDYYPGQKMNPLEYNHIYQIKRSAFEKLEEELDEKYIKYQLDMFSYESDLPDAFMVL